MGEAVDVADFIKDGQAQAAANAGHALQELIVTALEVFGQAHELLLHGLDLVIVMLDHGQVVLERIAAQFIVFGSQELLFPGVAVAPGLFGWNAVVGQLVGVNAGEQLRATPNVKDSLTQERPQRPLVGGIDIGWWNEV